MDHYGQTLEAIKALLEAVGKNNYAGVVQECIDKWKESGDSAMFRDEFSPKGRFGDFRLDSASITDPEKGYWTAQTFSALIAMAAQLAVVCANGSEADMGFLRKNFGAGNEVMNVGRCASCGRIEATAADVDKYASRIVIAKKVVDGLESGKLTENALSLIDLSAPEIERERRKTRLRLENSGIAINPGFGKLVCCQGCGSEKIVEWKLLRSNVENIFIPLTH